MLRQGTEHTGRSVRWLLLACTLFGLATMHTLGHAGMQLHAHDHPAAPAAASPAESMHDLGAMKAAATAATGDVCDGGCAHSPGPPAPHGGMIGWSVCLAVLGALAMVFLITTLGARFRRREPPPPDTGSWTVVSRGPPFRPVGLAMAAVSVLRI